MNVTVMIIALMLVAFVPIQPEAINYFAVLGGIGLAWALWRDLK